MNLYPYQRQGVDFLKSRRAALLADDMGLGKTVQLLVALKELNCKNNLIICPASVKLNWRRELNIWYPGQNIRIAQGSDCKFSNAEQNIIINYDILRYENIFRQLKARKYDCIICDESHYLKNTESQRTHIVLGRETPIEELTGLVYNTKRVYLSTGTPILNRPVEVFVFLKTLYPQAIKDCPDFESFAIKYCEGYQDRHGFFAKGASNTEELAEKMKPFYIRREKSQVLKDLPEKVIQEIPLETTAEIEQTLSYLEEGNLFTENQQLGWTATVRRVIAEQKVPQALDYIHEILVHKEKLVLFAYHHSVIRRLEEKLRPLGVSVLTGKQTPKQKQEAIDAFVDGRNSIFIGQINAAGQGIDGLQKVCDTAIFVEFSWVPGENAQAQDRLLRIGQKNTVFIHVLYLPDTLEETMLYVNKKKQGVIDTLIVNTQYEDTEMTIENEIRKLTTAVETLTGVLQGADIATLPVENAKESDANEEKAPAETKKPAAKAETKTNAKAAVTLEDLRACTKDLMAGKDTPEAKKAVADQIKAAIESFGGTKLQDLDPKKYAACLKTFLSLGAKATAEVSDEF